MHKEIEDISISRKRVHFHVPVEQVRERLDRAYDDLRKRVRVDGFRPGKAPIKILEQRFGKQVRGDVAAGIIRSSWEKLAPTLQPLGQPAVNQGEMDRESPFIFTITVDVRPELKVEGYKGMEVQYPVIDIGEETVDQVLRRRL
jgi:trigger factor